MPAKLTLRAAVEVKLVPPCYPAKSILVWAALPSSCIAAVVWPKGPTLVISHVGVSMLLVGE